MAWYLKKSRSAEPQATLSFLASGNNISLKVVRLLYGLAVCQDDGGTGVGTGEVSADFISRIEAALLAEGVGLAGVFGQANEQGMVFIE